MVKQGDAGRTWALRICALVLTLGTALPVAAGAAEQLPYANQGLLLLRALAYDRNLSNRAKKTVVVVVLYRTNDAESSRAQAGMLSALNDVASKLKVGGMPVHVKSQPFVAASVGADLLASGATAVYLCTGLDDAIEKVSTAARKGKILTFSGDRADVEAGLSIGLVARGGKAGVALNLVSARAEGAILDSALLRIADIVE